MNDEHNKRSKLTMSTDFNMNITKDKFSINKVISNSTLFLNVI